MRIRTFESFWLVKNGILNSYPSLQQDSETELLVIGGGITGALISHALMEAGHEVLLIDKRDIAFGSSSATTSMLQYEVDVPLYELAEMIGEDGAVKCYRAGIEAIHQLRHLVKRTKIKCGFKMQKSLYVAHNGAAVAGLKKEFEIRNKHDLGVQWLDAKTLEKKYGIIAHGGILSEVAASVDAYQLAHALIQLNAKRGMKVYDQTDIDQIDTTGSTPKVVLKNGRIIKAQKIICCTGFESTELLKEKIADLFYTYATVSEQGIQLNKNVQNTLIWTTDDPYLYMRTTDDGRLLIGGEDSNFNFQFFQQKIKERKADKLKAKLSDLIPNVSFTEDFSWAGTFGSTKDGLPYIGESPEYKNTLFVLGFGGNGITFSIQGMDMIVDFLNGKEHELRTYYRFGR